MDKAKSAMDKNGFSGPYRVNSGQSQRGFHGHVAVAANGSCCGSNAFGLSSGANGGNTPHLHRGDDAECNGSPAKRCRLRRRTESVRRSRPRKWADFIDWQTRFNSLILLQSMCGDLKKMWMYCSPSRLDTITIWSFSIWSSSSSTGSGRSVQSCRCQGDPLLFIRTLEPPSGQRDWPIIGGEKAPDGGLGFFRPIRKRLLCGSRLHVDGHAHLFLDPSKDRRGNFGVLPHNVRKYAFLRCELLSDYQGWLYNFYSHALLTPFMHIGVFLWFGESYFAWEWGSSVERNPVSAVWLWSLSA